MQVKLVYKWQERKYTLQPDMTGEQLRKQITKIFNIPEDELGLYFLNANNQKISITEQTKKLLDCGLDEHSLVNIRSLGKQIKWTHVFYIEYLGPIVIIPLFYYFGRRQRYNFVHHMAAFMGVTHFIKRQLQTKFVHVFSRKTMPFKRVFINSAHYWILFGLLNSIELFLFPKQTKWDSNDIMILFIVWLFMEFCNYKCHQQLSSFRKKDKKGRGIPKKWGFKYVSCANYLWQSLGWVTFSILTKCYSSLLFTAVSIAQMASWALKKHKAYKKQFGDQYPKQRKALIPYLL